MKKILHLTSLLLSMFVIISTIAQPSNNNCSGAIQLTPNGGSSQFTISNSTKSSISFNGEDNPVISDVYFYFIGPNDADYSKIFNLLVEDVNLNAPSYTGSKKIMYSDLGADIFTNSCSSPKYKKSIWDDGLNPQKTYLPQGSFYLDSTDKGKVIYVRISAVQYRKTGDFKISINYTKKSSSNNNGNNGNNNGNSFSFSIPSSIDVNWDVKSWKFDVTSNDSKCTWAAKLTKGNTGNFINATTGSGNGTLNGFFLNTNSSYTDIKELEAEVLDCKNVKHRITIRQLPKPEPVEYTDIQDLRIFSTYKYALAANNFQLSGKVVALNRNYFGTNPPTSRTNSEMMQFNDGVIVDLNNNRISNPINNAKISVSPVGGNAYNALLIPVFNWDMKVVENKIYNKVSLINTSFGFYGWNMGLGSFELLKEDPISNLAGIKYNGKVNLPIWRDANNNNYGLEIGGLYYQRKGICAEFSLQKQSKIFYEGKKINGRIFSLGYNCGTNELKLGGGYNFPNLFEVDAELLFKNGHFNEFNCKVESEPNRGVPLGNFAELYKLNTTFKNSDFVQVELSARPKLPGISRFHLDNLLDATASGKFYFGKYLDLNAHLTFLNIQIYNAWFKASSQKYVFKTSFNLLDQFNIEGRIAQQKNNFELYSHASFKWKKNYLRGKLYAGIIGGIANISAFGEYNNKYIVLSGEWNPNKSLKPRINWPDFELSYSEKVKKIDEYSYINDYFGNITPYQNNFDLREDYNNFYAIRGPIMPSTESTTQENSSKNKYFFSVNNPNNAVFVKLIGKYSAPESGNISCSKSQLAIEELLKDSLSSIENKTVLLYLLKPKMGNYIIESEYEIDSIQVLDFPNPPSCIIKNIKLQGDILEFEAKSLNDSILNTAIYLDNDQIGFDGNIVGSTTISENLKKIQFDISNIGSGRYFLHYRINNSKLDNFSYVNTPIILKNKIALDPPIIQISKIENDTITFSWKNDTLLNHHYYLQIHNDSSTLFTEGHSIGVGDTCAIKINPNCEYFLPGKKYYFAITDFGDSCSLLESFQSNIVSFMFKSNYNNAPVIDNFKNKYYLKNGFDFIPNWKIFDFENDKIEINIIKAPLGFQIVNNKPEWKPNREQLGVSEIVFELKDQQYSSIYRCDIDVYDDNQKITLEFNKPYYFDKNETAILFVEDLESETDSLIVEIKSSSMNSSVKSLFYKLPNTRQFYSNFNLSFLNLSDGDSIFIIYKKTSDFAHYSKSKVDFGFKDSICATSSFFALNKSIGDKFKYQWFLDDSFILNTRNFEFTFPKTFGIGYTKYTLKLRCINEFGKTFDESKIIHISNLPNSKKNYPACIGKNSEISPVFYSNLGIKNLNWFNISNNIIISNDKKTFFINAKDTTISINYSLIDNLGCTNFDTINIIGVYPPKASFSSPSSACEKDVIPIKNTTYTTSPLGFNNLWLSENVIFSKSINSKISYKNYGTILISLVSSTATGCSDTFSQKITINPNPIPKFSITADKNFCENDTFSLIDISNPVLGKIIQSEFSANNSVLYGNEVKTSFESHGEKKITLKTTNTFGCSATISDTLRIYSLPRIKLFYFRTDSCEYTNQNKIWSVVSTPDNQEIIKKHWNFKTSTMDSIKLHFKNHGNNTVYFSAETENHCTSNDSIKIEVYPQGVPQFDVKDVCLNEISEFKNESYDANFDRFIWHIEKDDNFETKDVNYKYKSVGKKDFSLTTITERGCKNQKMGQIEVFSLPKAKLIYQKADTLFSDYTSSFYSFNASISRNAEKYIWFFNKNLSDTIVAFSKRFLDTSFQNVQLVVKNNNGCRDTAFLNLMPTPKHIFHIPNAFSPNNDELNDMFIPIGNPYCKNYLLEIYNRWGQKIFESKDRNISWNAENTMEGVYIYKITFQELDGKFHYYSGSVTVLK